jgi:hypothetical protein
MISSFSKFRFKIWTDLLEKWAIGIVNLQHEKDLGVLLTVGPGCLILHRFVNSLLYCVRSAACIAKSTECCWRLQNWYAGRPRFGLPTFPAANCSQLFLVLSIHYVCCNSLRTSSRGQTCAPSAAGTEQTTAAELPRRIHPNPSCFAVGKPSSGFPSSPYPFSPTHLSPSCKESAAAIWSTRAPKAMNRNLWVFCNKVLLILSSS